MFGDDARYRLIEPPVQVESHLYQTVQCADWLCGLFGRLAHYECEPTVKADYKAIHDYFDNCIHQVSTRSGIKKLKSRPTAHNLQKLVDKFSS